MEAHGIGPTRARQIILYREATGGIASVDQLAEAASISTREAERISQTIPIPANMLDWQNLSGTALIVVLAGILILQLSTADYGQTIVLMVNISAGLLIFALITSALSWFLYPLQRIITAIAICLGFSGTFLVITSTIVSQLISVTPALTTHLADSLVILGILGLMYWFIFAATLQLRWVGAIRRDSSDAIDTLARWLDGSTLALASVVAVLCLVPSTSLPTLFTLWSAVMVLIGGIHLWGGESTYLIALSKRDCARIQWVYSGNYLSKASRTRRLGSLWLLTCSAAITVSTVVSVLDSSLY